MFADEMRRAREAKGVTKYRLAKISGVSEGLISRLEGGHQLPSLDTVAKLASALDVDIATLRDAADADRLARMGIAATIPGLTTAAQMGASVVPTQEGPKPIGQNTLVPLPAWRISCGDLMQLDTTPDAIEHWPREVVGDANAVMAVHGTSMLGCGFKPGDKLFVRMLDGRRPTPGEEVVARIGQADGGYTCKVYRKDKLGPYLEAAPGEGEPWRRPCGPDVTLIAVVTGVYSPRGKR